MYDGMLNSLKKDELINSSYVWPVRTSSKSPIAAIPKTGQVHKYIEGDDGDIEAGVSWPSPRFIDNGDGTVTDSLTGLVWVKNINCIGTATWTAALDKAANFPTLGQQQSCGLSDGSKPGDWRLPNINELRSILDYSNSGPALPTDHKFITGPKMSSYFWTSTTHQINGDYAWTIDLNTGRMYKQKKSYGYAVWLVRGGKSSFSLNVTKSGSGKGVIKSSPAGIDCGEKCNATYELNTIVTLIPEPLPGYTFVAWNGDEDCADSKVIINKNKNCIAVFETTNVKKVYKVTVTAQNSFGQIEPNMSQNVIEGEKVNFFLKPKEGFKVWKIEPSDSINCKYEINDGTLSIGPVTSDCSFNVKFNKKCDHPNYTMAICLAEDSEWKESYNVGESIKVYLNYRTGTGININLNELSDIFKITWQANNANMINFSYSDPSATKLIFKSTGKVRVYGLAGEKNAFIDFQVGSAGTGESKKQYGNLIIVAGGDQTKADDKLKLPIQVLSKRIYETFKKRGFTDEDIYYINHVDYFDPSLQIEVDSKEKTVAHLQYAITEWAANQENEGPLYIYLVDHGYKDGLFLVGKGEYLKAQDLASYLKQFEDKTNRKTIILIEACFSGSFIKHLQTPNRAIFTSSSPDVESYMEESGVPSFSAFMSLNLLRGDDWNEAFEKAKTALNLIKGPYPKQSPQKYIGNQIQAQSVGGKFVLASDGLNLENYTTGKAIGSCSQFVPLTVTVGPVMDPQNLAVWALIEPPGYSPPKIEDPEAPPGTGIIKLQLTPKGQISTGIHEFESSYVFKSKGNYQIIYVAISPDGEIGYSEPQTFVVTGDDCTSEYTFQNANFTCSFGWSLLSAPVVIDAQTQLNDTPIKSVWKWNKGDSTWDVKLPFLGDKGKSYASAKGFGFLTKINPGEGFWINSDSTLNLTVEGPKETGTLAVSPGWNLLGLRTAKTYQIDQLIGANGSKIKSLWKWSNNTWQVYLPSEGDKGASYAISKGFALIESISPNEGFWINASEEFTIE